MMPTLLCSRPGGMMRKSAVVCLLWIIAVSFPSHSQEHAPTPAVCRADVAVWGNLQAETDYSKAETAWLTNRVSNQTAIAKLSIKEMMRRGDEMSQCEDVDPDQENTYRDLQMFYHGVRHDRYARFIYRHHLMPQLMQEDAVGRR